MSTLTSLAKALEREREALLGTIAWLPDIAFEQPNAVGRWSIQSVLAHLAAWERLVVHTLSERLLTGASSEAVRAPALDPAEDDGCNAEVVSIRERLSPAEQVLELEGVRSDLLNLLGKLGEQTLERARPWPGWEGTVAEYVLAAVRDHEREHHAAIRAAVADLAPLGEYWPGVRTSRELAVSQPPLGKLG